LRKEWIADSEKELSNLCRYLRKEWIADSEKELAIYC